MVWDVTCPDTFASSHVSRAADIVASVANEAEHSKIQKYGDLDSIYSFYPIAIETSGVYGVGFLSDLGRRLADSSGDPRSSFFLQQKLSIVIQRGNSISVFGSLPSS